MTLHDFRCVKAGCEGNVTNIVAFNGNVPKWKKCPECGARMPQSWKGGNIQDKGRKYPFWHPGFGMEVTSPGHLKQLCKKYNCHEAADKVGGANPIDLDRQAAAEDDARPTFEEEMAQNFADEINAGYQAGWTDELDHNTELDETTRPHITPDKAFK